MPEKLTVGMLANLIKAAEEVLDMIHAPTAAKMIDKLRKLVEGDEFTRGSNVRELSELFRNLDLLNVHIMRLKTAEVAS